MKKILIFIAVLTVLLSANNKPYQDKKTCQGFQKSIIKLISIGEVFYINKDKVKFDENIQLQQATIKMFNDNLCYFYFDNPLKLKAVGEKTILHLEGIIDGTLEGGLK